MPCFTNIAVLPAFADLLADDFLKEGLPFAQVSHLL
jgi:hypothetical protein